MEDSSEEYFFEIIETENCFIKIEAIEKINYVSSIDWDNNWIKSILTFQSGSFSGKMEIDIMTIDYEKFKQELLPLYENLKGAASFADIEKHIEIIFKGDGKGHFGIDVEIRDDYPELGKLTFPIRIDQTMITPIIYQLNKITKKFPILGDFKIKNI